MGEKAGIPGEHSNRTRTGKGIKRSCPDIHHVPSQAGTRAKCLVGIISFNLDNNPAKQIATLPIL